MGFENEKNAVLLAGEIHKELNKALARAAAAEAALEAVREVGVEVKRTDDGERWSITNVRAARAEKELQDISDNVKLVGGVTVREGGGPEAVSASVAVTLANLVAQQQEATKKADWAEDSEQAWVKTYEETHGALLEAEKKLEAAYAQGAADHRALHDALGWAHEWHGKELPKPWRAVEEIITKVKDLTEKLDFERKYSAALVEGLARSTQATAELKSQLERVYGTPEIRFVLLTDKLGAVFPHPEPFRSDRVPEEYYMRAVTTARELCEAFCKALEQMDINKRTAWPTMPEQEAWDGLLLAYARAQDLLKGKPL